MEEEYTTLPFAISDVTSRVCCACRRVGSPRTLASKFHTTTLLSLPPLYKRCLPSSTASAVTASSCGLPFSLCTRTVGSLVFPKVEEEKSIVAICTFCFAAASNPTTIEGWDEVVVALENHFAWPKSPTVLDRTGSGSIFTFLTSTRCSMRSPPLDEERRRFSLKLQKSKNRVFLEYTLSTVLCLRTLHSPSATSDCTCFHLAAIVTAPPFEGDTPCCSSFFPPFPFSPSLPPFESSEEVDSLR
mmetsp:Transcript_5261/g.11703  ORF Transcript_5261/g.11703 Transcript_5261/m.11703 type:complete len:244 (+) Transcript_5261:1147-1878(+)